MLLALLLLQDPLVYTVDPEKRKPISRWIYGHNEPGADWPGVTLARSGGNRLTAYNWETNASHAGADWKHQNDGFLGGGDVPGEAVRKAVAAAHARGAACVVTVPIAGRVAADKRGGGDVGNDPARFLPSRPFKDGPFAETPDLGDGVVFQDEFVAFVERRFPGERPPIFYALDNEPELWASTHPRVRPEKLRCDELLRLNVQYAGAVKRAAPRALVFGFVSYGWHGLTTLQDAPDRAGRDFTELYLAEMAAVEKRTGRRLIDVLDFHWYPEARGGGKRVTEDDAAADVAAARIQAPRSLWDPTYREDSWIGGPIRLLPRLREKIEKHYPGTRLAMTEYYYGGGADISGAIAQADVLGILGREGVFAAALWHLGKTDDRFIRAAFAMFRDFDGRGGAFGDEALAVSGGDPARASLYASLDAGGRAVLVAINKTREPLLVRVEGMGGGRAQSWRLTSAEPRPVPAGEVDLGALVLPPLSVNVYASPERYR